MDQDSNGAGADKRNWRERLGIGAKELPKLSDEFREEPQVAPPPPAGTAKPAPRAPVTKPAPMAPRVAPKPQAAAESASPSPVPPPLSRATPKVPDNAAQDALAEKLRAQRAAAERLAEQRVQAARNRAETKPRSEPAAPRGMTSAPLPPGGGTPPRPAAPVSRSPGLTPSSGAARPKFSFADENRQETSQRPGLGSPAPLTPPRPALGGERGQPPFLRPGSAANGGLGARPQPAFRPTSTEGGSGYLAPPRLQPPAAPRSGLGADTSGYGGARIPARRSPPALDPYSRQQPAPEPREYPEDDYDDDGRATPRLGRPGAPARGRAEDFDEVFEDDAAPRARVAARDYQPPYADGDEGFADETRRSSGPWLLLLALLAAAVLTGVVVWFYSDSVRHLAGVGSSSTSGSTPVVPAPTEPAKVAAPDTAGGDGQTEAPSARKKQIYDRIVGEQEVTGQMQPTEETPVTPDAAQPAADGSQSGAGQPAAAVPPAAGQPAAAVDQVPKIQPTGNANQIPAPDAPTQGATGQGLPDPEPPAPLPIPGADGQQGNLGLKGGSQVAAASAQPDQGSTPPPPPPPATSQTSSSDATLPPPPEKATDGAALVSGGDSSGTGMVGGDDQAGSAGAAGDGDQQPAAAASTSPAKPAQTQSASAQQPAATTPTKKKPAKKPAASGTSQQPNYNNLGSAPVVLVPPSKQAAADAQSYAADTAPAMTTAPAVTAEQPATTPAATPAKRKTIFDLFNGGSGSSTTTAAAPAAPTQVASAATQSKQATTPVTQPKAGATTAPSATGGGYVIQLASFRTDGEAKTEYSRLAKTYPAIVGPLRSQIRQTTVGGSTRYQLGLGPLPTRGDATRVCGQLIEAGESDCIVRGP